MARLTRKTHRVALASRQRRSEHGRDARATRCNTATGVASYNRRARRGAVIVIVMVCFIVAGAIFVSLARLAAVERQAVRSRHWAMQARWLAEAALERAVARLDEDADYTGETWTVAAEEFSGRHGAVARIGVERVAEGTGGRRIRVEADYPDDPRHRCRCRKEIVVDRGQNDNPFSGR